MGTHTFRAEKGVSPLGGGHAPVSACRNWCVSPLTPVFSSAQPTLCVANCTNDLAYFSHTVGFALRYNTPIGPVSIDLGYQLNPAQFLVPIGTAAPGQPQPLTLERLSAFQFFVNLGTTF